MKKILRFSILISFLFIFILSSHAQTPVQTYGQLRVSGRYLVDKNGTPVVLRGMSLFWSQWGYKYWNSSVINWVATDWKVSVIRAAMGVEEGGYLSNPTYHKDLVKTVVDACINAGLYVIIDWHDHNAPAHQTEAINFFREMAQTYGSYPNVIYEIFNEPDTDDTWSGIKSYAQAVISAIRQYDPDNVILVGTPNWCQDVDVASQSPLTGVTNVMYTLHFYAASHGSYYRQKAQTAINNGLPIFVSEFGTCEYTGDGAYNFTETDTWINFLEQNKISWVNWSLNDKAESASALVPNASTSGGWSESQLTESGKYVRNKIRAYNNFAGGVITYLASCSSGSIVWATTNVVVNVTAGNGVSKVEFYVDNTLKYTDTSSPYSYSWDTTQYSDGWHNIKIIAYDTQNNTSQVTSSVIVYNANSPTVNITNLQNGSTVYGTSLAVYVDANKGYEKTIQKAELYINNSKLLEDTTAPFSFTIDTTKYPDGNISIRAVAYDIRNNQGSKQITVYVKNKDDPPTVTITYPQNNTTVGGTVTIQVEALDDRGISKVEFYIDSSKKFTDTGSPYSWNWDTTQYTEGQHTISVIAYDTSNQQAQASITVNVSRNVQIDNPPSISFINPQNGQTLSGVITVEVYASDDKGVSRIELFINNQKIYETSSYPYTYNLNTQSYSNGQHTLKAVAYDTSNQQAEVSITVNIDNQSPPPPPPPPPPQDPQDNPPSISIILPQDNDVIDKILNLTLNVSDDKGISRLDVYLNNSLIAQYTYIQNTYIIDVSYFNNDKYELKVVVYDTSNNFATVTRTITINNTFTPVVEKEELSLTPSLIENAVLRGQPNIQISAYAENGISRLEIYINDELYETIVFETQIQIKNFNFNYTINTFELTEGKTNIKIVLYDSAGNSKQSVYNVEVDNFKDNYFISLNDDGINDNVFFDAHSEVKIYNLKGQLIKTITGYPKIWYAEDERGTKVAPGVYIYKILNGNKTLAVGTITVIK